MHKQRPKNLDLTTVALPVTATASILHRISGIIVFIALAIFLSLLSCSLASEADYDRVLAYFDMFVVEFIIWGALTGLAYHVVFGIRHMIQDLGYWEELPCATLSAKVGFAITLLLSILSGVLVW
ncbi:succinate dehydrogenase, cytochrome b556 subunit [Psychromonas sp. MME2]|uniref:succinate dehydrogenase, cytochrome b556 subunit n=1 Tax=unclassified Psychromonas TaxID=2614957 RepID=UPI00339CD0CD